LSQGCCDRHTNLEYSQTCVKQPHKGSTKSGLLKAGGCLTEVNISTNLTFRNILFGCLRQVSCLIEVTANTGLTVYKWSIGCIPELFPYKFSGYRIVFLSQGHCYQVVTCFQLHRASPVQVCGLPDVDQDDPYGDERRPAVLQVSSSPCRGQRARLPHGQLQRPQRRGAAAGERHRGTV